MQLSIPLLMAKNNSVCCRSDNVYHQTFLSNATQILIFTLWLPSIYLYGIDTVGIHDWWYKELGSTKAFGKKDPSFSSSCN